LIYIKQSRPRDRACFYRALDAGRVPAQRHSEAAQARRRGSENLTAPI